MRNTEVYKNNSLQLLSDHGLLQYPVDIKELANKLKINVNYETLDDDISGKIEYNPGSQKEITITIDENEIEFRQNFSLAHEIGHYIHDIDFTAEDHFEIEDQRIFLRSSTVNPIEKRANKYAERLLMPKDLFNNRVNEIKNEHFSSLKNKLGLTNIYKIVTIVSKDFKVSKPAVIMRLGSIKKISQSMKNKLFEYHTM